MDVADESVQELGEGGGGHASASHVRTANELAMQALMEAWKLSKQR